MQPDQCGPVSVRPVTEYTNHFDRTAGIISGRAPVEGLSIGAFDPVCYCAVSSTPQEQESRIAQVMAGGKRPQGWTSADEQSRIDAQNIIFTAIHDYLGLFPDKESLLGAAVNLTGRIHTAANYPVELRMDDAGEQE